MESTSYELDHGPVEEGGFVDKSLIVLPHVARGGGNRGCWETLDTFIFILREIVKNVISGSLKVTNF